MYFVSAALFVSFLVFFQVLQRDLSWLTSEPNERGGRVDNGPNRRDSNALGAAVRYSEYLEAYCLLPDVRVISMFGFWERAVNCMDISDVIYRRVMRSSEFLDVEPETWPWFFCEALPRLFGFFPPLQAKSGDMLECRLCIKRHQKQAITRNKYCTCVLVDPSYALLRINQWAVQKHPSEIST